MLFWHTHNYLLSWAYVAPAVAVLVGCRLARVVALGGGLLRVTVPTTMHWHAGQYVYLCLPAVSPVQSHPFTIASVCSALA
ncbi:hypothetical protein B0H63DRAFT_490382 [Podospora didyma]|uniref:ferric-chelate reductase (NADPH) n=1 Tax=Podospora didyma TaxID=330526 RepID=A0AAE0N0R4_9PEZI|nr:hypothetical protein B0H63DRAFT_490382 [Podospora didyma]